MEKTKGEIAKEYFMNGYNCAQAVALAFETESGLDRDTLLKVSSSFGGGLGRLREVCGAVSGMSMILGLIYGYTENGNDDAKREHYKRVQELCNAFKDVNGSIVCRTLTGLDADGFNPTPRNGEFYKKRPCGELVRSAADILDDYIKNH